MDSKVSQAETEISAALAARDLQRAAELTLGAYGSEILGFLIAQLKSDQYAEEVFSVFAEDLWRSLDRLTLQTSMRAYAYSLARNAKHRFLARDLRKQRAALPLSQLEQLSQLVAQARTATAPYQATGTKQKLTELRDRLSEDEQALLTLRLDRGLGWREIAEIFGESDLTRGAAQKRKRFQLLKEKLTRWAREEGLLDPDTE